MSAAKHRRDFDRAITVTDNAIIADASKVSGRDFYRTIFRHQIEREERDREWRARFDAAQTNREWADLMLESLADHIGKPLSELQQKDKWL